METLYRYISKNSKIIPNIIYIIIKIAFKRNLITIINIKIT